LALGSQHHTVTSSPRRAPVPTAAAWRWAPGPVWMSIEKKISCPSVGLNPGPASPYQVAITTELSRLLQDQQGLNEP